jgi:undecaprenyl-diphosphatase
VRRHRWNEGAATVVAVGGAGLLNSGVKRIVGRRRPRGRLGVRGDRNSFPSGHSSGSVALLGVGAFLASRRARDPWAGILFPLAGALAGSIGYSRVALRRHHPGDVVAGYLLGTIWLALVLRALRWWETKEAAGGQPPSFPSPDLDGTD